MANLSKLKRDKMLALLDDLKKQNSSNNKILSELNEIQSKLTEKKYGLVWEEHSEKIDEDMEENIPVFKYEKSNSIISQEQNKTNFLLEGDNLHSLYLLEKTNKGKIQAIYIDPPYNTGNKDFKYNDNFVEIEDSYVHSKWLSFMAKRLKIARNLLMDDGVIFISIDDNEQANLKLLCDSIFGDACFVATLAVELTQTQGMKVKSAKTGSIVKGHEYVLVYIKNPNFKTKIVKNILYNKAKTPFDTHFGKYWDYETKEPINLMDWLDTTEFSKDYFKKFNLAFNKDNISNLMLISDEFNNFIIDNAKYIFNQRNIDSNEIQQLRLKENVITKYKKYLLIKPKNSTKILQLQSFDMAVKLSDDYIPKVCRTTIRGTLWKGFEEDLPNLDKEGGVDFKNGKKPIRLIKQLLKWVINKDSIILDFFAGSGSTGQAVLELNKELKLNNVFILCTNNEGGICKNVTLQRMKNIISGGQKSSDKNSSTNLTYLKTELVKRNSEDLVNELNKHVKEMISLDTCKKIESNDYIIILTDDDADNFEKNIKNYSMIKTLFISDDVMLTISQQEKFKKFEIKSIPSNYFDFELREQGEIF